MIFTKKRLWHAIENGDAQEALAVIREDPDVNEAYHSIENELDLPPLLHALNRFQPIIASYLLDAGADASLLDSQGNSALYYFIKRGFYAYPELGQRLIERGVDMNARIDGYTPLYWAMIKMPVFATYLINQGADLQGDSFVSSRENTIIWPYEVIQKRSFSYIALAVEQGDYENFKLLLQKNAPLNKPDSEGMTALMRAVQKEEVRLFHELLRSGADTDPADRHGRKVYDFLKELVEKKKNAALKVQAELQEAQYLLSAVSEKTQKDLRESSTVVFPVLPKKTSSLFKRLVSRFFTLNK